MRLIMNANELAEIIEHLENARYIGASKAAEMLRQQQAEIEALKAAKIRAYNNGVEDGRKPNTHPANPYQSITNTKIEPTVVSYTHPVKELTETSYETVFDGEKYTTKLVEPKAKELTDEEIEDECRKAWGLHDQDQLNLEEVFKFARAILRKVQEADKIESLGTVNIGGVHFRNGKEVK